MLSVVSALLYLHGRLLIYRDIKPENIVLDAEGHVKLVDFAFAKQLASAADRAWTLCGTPQYLAPEVITSQGHSFPYDWWAVGILTFEVLTGYAPFGDESGDAMKIYKQILDNKVVYPRRVPKAPRDMIDQLLVADPTQRLGSSVRRGGDVAQHPFLRSLSLADLERRAVKPPHVPAPVSDAAEPLPPFEVEETPYDALDREAKTEYDKLSATFR